MFRMFPFMLNGINIFSGMFNDTFFNNMINQVLASSLVNERPREQDYSVEMKDHGDYYLLKGYLPGVSPKDISIDFERNRAILTIRRRQVYSNGLNVMMSIVETGGNLVKTFNIEEIDKSKIGAAFDRSILLLTLPKKKMIKKYGEEETPIIVDVDSYEVE